jgi:kinesin family protein 11
MHSKSITVEVKSLSAKLEEFIKASNQSTMKLRAEAKQYQTKELEILAGQSEQIDTQLQRVQDALQVIQTKDAISNEAVAVIQSAVKDAQESFKNGFATWSETLRKSCEVICNKLQTTGGNDLGTVSLYASGGCCPHVNHL